MKHIFTLLVFFLAMVFTACERPLPTITGVDLDTWKKDKKGCGGVRSALIKELEDQRNKIQGLSEMQVIELLGRPDEYNLSKRHQKFFTYWLEPGKPCGLSGEPKKLSIRFNATGAAKEIAVE